MKATTRTSKALSPKRVASKANKQKWTDARDDADDKKRGIKEGSKKDRALDKKRGIPEDEPKQKKPMKRLKNPTAF